MCWSCDPYEEPKTPVKGAPHTWRRSQLFLARLKKEFRRMLQLWQGDNERCDIERCDGERCDIERCDIEQKVQILVEMGFAEDDVRGALNENGCNVLLALLVLCAQNTNT